MTLPQLSLIFGGARSGKTSLAEMLAHRTGLPATYVATAEALDDEMMARIARHQQDRGDGWQTVEAPLDLAAAVQSIPAGRVILLDCLTLWLSNQMQAGRDPGDETPGLLAVLHAYPGPVICVSNEVGMGLVPETALGREFRDAQGRLNQAVAAEAGLVVLVAAGIPLVLKGKLP